MLCKVIFTRESIFTLSRALFEVTRVFLYIILLVNAKNVAVSVCFSSERRCTVRKGALVLFLSLTAATC
jgi:hypothetical protein